jgi:hypothetical protein
MDETSEPQPENERGHRFVDNIDYFPKNEQAEAKSYASIYDRVIASLDHSLDAYNAIEEFSKKLIAEKGDNYMRNCKLFHLLIGSGMLPTEWDAMPMDTPGGDYETFINGPLMELLTKQGF